MALAIAALAAAALIVYALGWRGEGRPGTEEEVASLLLLGVAVVLGLGEARRMRAEADRNAERERRTRAELDRESERRARVERSFQTSLDWNRKLREKLSNVHEKGGALADVRDVPTLVLQISIALLDAGKGLLLSRHHGRSGELELVAAHGFENSPRHSAVAQRFANEVIERDSTIREDDPSRLVRGDRSAADDEIENLVAIPIYIRDEFNGVVVCANKPGGFHDHDDEVLLALGDHAGAILESASLRGNLRSSYLATVRILADALDAKDPFLRGHSEEVSTYVTRVADRLGLDSKRREELLFGSLLHDLGKIGISERILLKPGPLTPEEFNVIKLHPRIGYRLLQQVPALDEICLGVLHHHERYDGSGYPGGLKGEEIPLEARIICVADSFSAMTSDRPYRGRMRLDEACAELERCAGTQFDPEIVSIFVDELRRQPPTGDGASQLAEAMSDPELANRRQGDEPVLGYGSYAITDNLTLLYSYRYIHEMADAEAHRSSVQGSTFAVVLTEITNLADINHDRGYAEGDATIKRVAQAVQTAAVRSGGTASRYGGPRLCLLVPNASEDAARRIAKEIDDDAGDGAKVRSVVATWGPGDAGRDVIERARRRLSEELATAR